MDSTNSSSRDHTKPVMRKRCKYQVRRFYSKGAIFVLLWTTLVSATCWSYITDLGERILQELDEQDRFQGIIALPLIAIPLLGWLADAKLGNYRVFKISYFFLLIGTIINCAQILYFPLLNSIALGYTSAVITVLGYGVCATNIAVCFMTALQLGLDQMPDASSTNVSASSVGLFFPSILDAGLLTGYQVHSCIA